MAARSWQTGPKGGKFYVTATGEKMYGDDALKAAHRDTLQTFKAGGAKTTASRVAAMSKLAQARVSRLEPAPAAKAPLEHLEHDTQGRLDVAPLSRGPGPVISRAQADNFAKGSALPQAFVRGTQRPHDGAFIAKETENLSLQGRGIYMVQAEDADMVSKYGTKQELRVNVRNPLDRYSKEGKAIENSAEYKNTLEHLKKHSPLRHWQSQTAIAFQAVAQSRGHDAVYYQIHEKKPEGGERPTGRIVLTVWDANKVAVVKD